MYQALDGHLIEVTGKGELLLGMPKDGRSRLIEVLSSHSFFYSYFRTLITGLTVESIKRVNPLNPKIKI